VREAGHSAARSIDDVDIVVRSLESVGREIARDFLVSHYHVPQPGYPKFLVQLVDPRTRLRIDIFPDLVGSIASAQERSVAGVPLRVLTADSILDHKLLTLSKGSSLKLVDSKHYRDARRLATICERSVPDVANEFLTETSYSAEIGPPCERCLASADTNFPLAPKQQIIELLGYV